MTVQTLHHILPSALKNGYGVAGFVVLGIEELRAFIQAGEACQSAIILQAGPNCRSYYPLKMLGAMFNDLAGKSPIPIVIHLDHATNLDECRLAIDVGFSSIMFDGSKLPLHENIKETAKAVKLARAAGISIEGEIGQVGYHGNHNPQGLTDPKEAKLFYEETGVDALAISIGNVHLNDTGYNAIDWERLREIETAIPNCPLALHGASGIHPNDRQRLATEHHICKFNIGTELRQVFGNSLRDFMAQEPLIYDHLTLLKSTIPPLTEAAKHIIKNLQP